MLRFDFPDSKSAGLHVRRAVAEFIEDSDAYPRDPDILLKLSSEAWAKVYLSAAPLDELIGGEEIDATQGDAAEAARVLGLFDRYDPDRAVVVPPTNPGAGAHVAPLQSRLKEHAYEGVQADESDDNAVGVAADTLEGPCRSRACCR